MDVVEIVKSPSFIFCNDLAVCTLFMPFFPYRYDRSLALHLFVSFVPTSILPASIVFSLLPATGPLAEVSWLDGMEHRVHWYRDHDPQVS